jgi:light-regulated signal transduction histidine kinase (bacteriophytochrome)
LDNGIGFEEKYNDKVFEVFQTPWKENMLEQELVLLL